MQCRALKRRRKSWFLAASALVSSSLGVSEPALAAPGTCTSPQPNPDPTTGIVTCTGDFTSSIIYGPPPPPPGPATQLHVILNPPVSVTTGPGDGVALNNFTNTVPVLLSANGATINVTQVPSSSGGNRGLYVETAENDATIMASGKIDVAGEGGGNHAIKAFVNATAGSGNASVTYTGPGLTGSGGTNSTDIQAQSMNGNASIDASGNMSGRVLSGQPDNVFTACSPPRG